MSKPLPPGRFSRLVLKVNVFLLIALVMVGGFLALVAYKQGWFVHQSPIHFVTANALGINKGMPVKLHGFTIGSVADMQLAATGIDVTLSIISEHLARIPEGSHARHIRESGVIGASVIDIVPGSSGRRLDAGAYINFEPSRGISEIIDDFRRQAVPAFNEIKQAMSQVGRSGEDVTQILAGLRQDAVSKATVWVLNPGPEVGEYDAIYRGLDGAELGRIAVRLGGGRVRQLGPPQHPLPEAGVADGFTVEVRVRSGRALAAAQVVGAAGDSAYLTGTTFAGPGD